jgi:hypothetical protein
MQGETQKLYGVIFFLQASEQTSRRVNGVAMVDKNLAKASHAKGCKKCVAEWLAGEL